MKSYLVAVLFIGGAAMVSTALWWLHRSAGLGFLGLAFVAVSFALAKTK